MTRVIDNTNYLPSVMPQIAKTSTNNNTTTVFVIFTPNNCIFLAKKCNITTEDLFFPESDTQVEGPVKSGVWRH